MEKKTLHIIILEDNPDDAELMVRELEREGFTVECSRVDTEEVFRKALEKKPDLILTDYKLPSFDGMAAISMRQQLAPEIPLIIVSGIMGEELAVECIKSGATDYVLKDRLHRLVPVVKRALDEAEERRKRRQAEEELKVARKRLELAMDAGEHGFWDWNIDTDDVYFSPRYYTMLGYESGELPMRLETWVNLMHPEDREGIVPQVQEYVKNSQPYEVEFRLRTKDDGWRWISGRGKSFEMDEQGNSHRALGVHVDITNRKKAEDQIKRSLKEKEVMLQEIHHRVKNNMQVISSLLNLQAGYIKDEQALELFRECQNRVRTMALIHERLYQAEDLASIDFADYIRSLAGGLLRMYRIDTDIIKLNIYAEDVFMDINTSIPCGLIINELVSNAFKHAFPEGREGEISITFKEDKADNRYTLIVSDDGVSFPVDLDFRETETLGMQLVNILTEQLHGTIEIDRSDGTSFKIVWESEKNTLNLSINRQATLLTFHLRLF